MAPRIASGNSPLKYQAGFGYLLVLLMVMLMGIGLGVAGTLWKTESQRIKENELLFIGEQYRKAIQSYAALPQVPKQYPKSLEDLLLDTRAPELTRHLRKLYRDPLTGNTEWGLVMDADTQRISGVYSLAPGKPIKEQGFGLRQQGFQNAENYQEWRFVAAEAAPPPAAPKVDLPKPENDIPIPDTF